MKKCDGSRDYKERKENRCNKDKDCGGANQDGPKCQTRDCNYCTDGKTGAKCWSTSECAAGYACNKGSVEPDKYNPTPTYDPYSGHCQEGPSYECGKRCDSDYQCASGHCRGEGQYQDYSTNSWVSFHYCSAPTGYAC